MKTNPSARWFAKVRITFVLVALAAVVGLEFYVGASLANQIGQNTATGTTQVPAIDISDLMAAAR
jgi:hypothetical protein